MAGDLEHFNLHGEAPDLGEEIFLTYLVPGLGIEGMGAQRLRALGNQVRPFTIPLPRR